MELGIRADSNVTALINVFVVEPSDQATLIGTLEQAAETFISRQPGFVAAGVHKSLDGHRVVVYSQWRSPDDIAAFRGKPETRAYFKRVADLAQFEPVVCSVTRLVGSQGGQPMPVESTGSGPEHEHERARQMPVGGARGAAAIGDGLGNGGACG